MDDVYNKLVWSKAKCLAKAYGNKMLQMLFYLIRLYMSSIIAKNGIVS